MKKKLLQVLHATLTKLWICTLFTASCTLNAGNQKQHTYESEILLSEHKATVSLKSLVLGKYNYRTDTNFIKVPKNMSSNTFYLQKEVYLAFCKMHDAAKKEGVSLKVVSGSRTFNEQKMIWEMKWKAYSHLKPIERAKKILEFSAMPATSRHHWGTDIDINNVNDWYFNTSKGKIEYAWLVQNANSFGFFQVYTEKSSGRTGYKEEKWHWSYLPLANIYLNYYTKNVTEKDITGFLGSEVAEEINIIEDYVNGVADIAKIGY